MTSTIRIALLDGDPVMCTALRCMLTPVEEFHLVGEANSRQQMAHLATRFRPHFFLIGGTKNATVIEDAVCLQQLHPKSHFIVFLHSTGPLPIVQLLTAKVDGCLFREEVNESLIHGLHLIMGGRAWFSRTIVEYLLKDLANQPAAPLDDATLTATEKKVLALLQRGLDNTQIAQKLYMNDKTVRNHAHHIYQKLGVNRLEIVARSSSHLFIESGT